MKRSLITLSFAALGLPLPAAAQDAQVTIYGTLLPFADNVRTIGATAPGLTPDAGGGASQVPAAAYTGIELPNRNRLTSGTSNVGFRGELRLGEHLKAFFQVESAVSPDGDPPNAWASRNSAVGLGGDYGTLFFGNWDTPYKYPILFVGAVRGLNPFDNALTANPGFNVPATTTQSGRINGKADAAFNRRQGNSVQYWTPAWEGLSARLAYSFDESRTTASDSAPSVSPELWSGLVSYDLGPIGLRYAYERHQDYFGLAQLGGSPGATLTNPHSKDDAHEVIVSYSLPTGTRLSVIGERLSYRSSDTADGAVDRYRRDAGYILVQQRIHAHQVWGSFGRALAGTCHKVGGAPCTTHGLSAQQWSIGYSYSLAKSADVYAAYYAMDNGRSATYAAFPSPGAVAPGANTRGFGLGVLYTFNVTLDMSAPKGP